MNNVNDISVSLASINTLSNELVVSVLEFVDPIYISKCLRVCRNWYALINNDKKIWLKLNQKLDHQSLFYEIEFDRTVSCNLRKGCFLAEVKKLKKLIQQMPIKVEKFPIKNSNSKYIVTVIGENHWSEELVKNFEIGFKAFLKLTRIGVTNFEEAYAIANEFVKHPRRLIGKKIISINDGKSLLMIEDEIKLQNVFNQTNLSK